MGYEVSVDPFSNVCRSDRAIPGAREGSGKFFYVPRSVQVGDQFVQSSGRLQGTSVREKDEVGLFFCAREKGDNGHLGPESWEGRKTTHSSTDDIRRRVGNASRTRRDRGTLKQIASRRHRGTDRRLCRPVRGASPVLR